MKWCCSVHALLAWASSEKEKQAERGGESVGGGHKKNQNVETRALRVTGSRNYTPARHCAQVH